MSMLAVHAIFVIFTSKDTFLIVPGSYDTYFSTNTV